ncbi:hypothetical protein [Natronosalvus rutilus]|uniref:Uncharacterized protein n=1 Tax=Natronosalvus rutilus TaxID=2953753 RepID=A0A9E7NBA9_9EURY|nr:hypothetical protein [Natronosalvus rutilus]UTF53813.1 hypothetical protein NGM29_00575 [Natronosalvus rutilus]
MKRRRSRRPSPPEIAAIVLVPVLAVTILASLVYFVAAKNGLENPAKWFAVVLVSARFGVVFSLLERAESATDEDFWGPHRLPGGPENGESASEREG